MPDTVTVNLVNWIAIHIALFAALFFAIAESWMHVITLFKHNATLMEYARLLYSSIPFGYKHGVQEIGAAFIDTGDLINTIATPDNTHVDPAYKTAVDQWNNLTGSTPTTSDPTTPTSTSVPPPESGAA